MSNSQYFNILGDPILNVLPPLTSGNILGIPDSVQARQTVNFNGDYNSTINEIGEIRVYESKYDKYYDD